MKDHNSFDFVRKKTIISDKEQLDEITVVVPCKDLNDAITKLKEHYEMDLSLFRCCVSSCQHAIDFYDSYYTNNIHYGFTVNNVVIEGYIDNIEEHAKNTYNIN